MKMNCAISLTTVLSLLMCINALKTDPESGFHRRSDHSDGSEQFTNESDKAQAVTLKEHDDRIIVVCVVAMIVGVGAFIMTVWALYRRYRARSYKKPAEMGETHTMPYI